VGSMFTVFFTRGPVTDFDSACTADRERYACFFREMLDRGVLLPPSQFEAAFLSAAHTEPDLDATLVAAREAFEAVSMQMKTAPASAR
jgi:glutamate-1-semialdehyde 2,1-aminomutase